MSRIQDILAQRRARRHRSTHAIVPDPRAPGESSRRRTSLRRPSTARLLSNPFRSCPAKEPAAPVTTVAAAPAADRGPYRAAPSCTRHWCPPSHRTRPSPSSTARSATRITQHEDHAPLRTVMVTSPGAGEGKSITAANLALTMAQEFQRRVVLVDADLRGPSVQALFGLDGDGPGLSEVLAGEATLDEALVYLPDYRLTVLPAGATPPFPTELLGSSAMRRALDTLRARFDRVLLDLPSVMPLADVGTVAPLADGVVMVVRAGATQRPALDQALAALEDTRILGIVLNEVRVTMSFRLPGPRVSVPVRFAVAGRPRRPRTAANAKRDRGLRTEREHELRSGN